MSKSRLQLLSEAEKDLDKWEKIAFENYVLGSLSIQVSDEMWNTALDCAKTCMDKYYPKKTAAVSRG